METAKRRSESLKLLISSAGEGLGATVGDSTGCVCTCSTGDSWTDSSDDGWTDSAGKICEAFITSCSSSGAGADAESSAS